MSQISKLSGSAMYASLSDPDVNSQPLSPCPDGSWRTMYPTRSPSTVILSVAMHPPWPGARGLICSADSLKRLATTGPSTPRRSPGARRSPSRERAQVLRAVGAGPGQGGLGVGGELERARTFRVPQLLREPELDVAEQREVVTGPHQGRQG